MKITIRNKIKEEESSSEETNLPNFGFIDDQDNDDPEIVIPFPKGIKTNSDIEKFCEEAKTKLSKILKYYYGY